MPLLRQKVRSGPALTLAALTTLIGVCPELVHPFVLVNVYVTVNIPVPLGVKEPLGLMLGPLQVPVPVPPVTGVAVSCVDIG